MRATFAVILVALGLPRPGVRGCGVESPPPPQRPLTVPPQVPPTVRIDVVPPDGELRQLCADERWADLESAGEVAEAFRPGDRVAVEAPCTLRVYRKDGALWVRSTPVFVHGGSGHVSMVLPDAPIGGLGVAFQNEADGVRVLAVYPGTPAEGRLAAGDLITAVDGVPTGGLDSWTFRALGTGPVGSEVAVEVASGDRTRSVLLIRRACDLPPPPRLLP